jgi:hypothetical protein
MKQQQKWPGFPAIFIGAWQIYWCVANPLQQAEANLGQIAGRAGRLRRQSSLLA